MRNPIYLFVLLGAANPVFGANLVQNLWCKLMARLAPASPNTVAESKVGSLLSAPNTREFAFLRRQTKSGPIHKVARWMDALEKDSGEMAKLSKELHFSVAALDAAAVPDPDQIRLAPESRLPAILFRRGFSSADVDAIVRFMDIQKIRDLSVLNSWVEANKSLLAAGRQPDPLFRDQRLVHVGPKGEVTLDEGLVHLFLNGNALKGAEGAASMLRVTHPDYHPFTALMEPPMNLSKAFWPEVRGPENGPAREALGIKEKNLAGKAGGLMDKMQATIRAAEDPKPLSVAIPEPMVFPSLPQLGITVERGARSISEAEYEILKKLYYTGEHNADGRQRPIAKGETKAPEGAIEAAVRALKEVGGEVLYEPLPVLGDFGLVSGNTASVIFYVDPKGRPYLTFNDTTEKQSVAVAMEMFYTWKESRDALLSKMPPEEAGVRANIENSSSARTYDLRRNMTAASIEADPSDIQKLREKYEAGTINSKELSTLLRIAVKPAMYALLKAVVVREAAERKLRNLKVRIPNNATRIAELQAVILQQTGVANQAADMALHLEALVGKAGRGPLQLGLAEAQKRGDYYLEEERKGDIAQFEEDLRDHSGLITALPRSSEGDGTGELARRVLLERASQSLASTGPAPLGLQGPATKP